MSIGMRMKKITLPLLLIHGAFLQSYTLLAQSSTNDEYAKSLPQTAFNIVDENGVNLSNGGLTLNGPSLSIGQKERGGLSIAPELVGMTAVPNYSNVKDCWDGGCESSGFYALSSNMAMSLSVGGWYWELMPRNKLPLSISTPSGIARFYVDNGYSDIKEYSPVRGRRLAYTSGNASEVSMDTGERMVLTDFDGTKYTFFYSSNWCNSSCGPIPLSGDGRWSHSLPVSKIEKPSGEIIHYIYSTSPAPRAGAGNPDYKLLAIYNNYGNMIKFQRATFTANGTSYSDQQVVGVNLSYEYCDPYAASCNLNGAWPMLQGAQAQNSLGVYDRTIVGPTGQSMRVRATASYPASFDVSFQIDEPGKAPYYIVYDYRYSAPPSIQLVCPNNGTSIDFQTIGCPFARVKSYARSGKTWTYSDSFEFPQGAGYPVSVSIRRDNPDGTFNQTKAQPTGQVYEITDENGRYFHSDVAPVLDVNEGRINAKYNPLGGKVSYSYDQRSNVISETSYPVTGSTQGAISKSFVYETTCSNLVTCNKATSSQDANGNVTNYSWDASHGGLLAVMEPAPTSGAARPLKLFTYVQRYAWIKNTAGSLVQAESPIWVKSTETSCQTLAGTNPVASCDTSATITTTAYEYGTTGTWQSLLVKGVAVTSNGITLRTCYAYDQYGNKLSETSPRANLSSCS